MVRQLPIQWSTIGLVAALTTGPPAFAEASWKLYDMRDLISELPPSVSQDAEPAMKPGLTSDPLGLYSPAKSKESKPTAQQGRNVDDLLDQICGAMDLHCTRLVTGIYGLEAEEAEHALVRNMLEQIRALYEERYAVELVLFPTSIGQAPPIGTVAPSTDHLYVQRFVVSRRTPTPVAIVSRTAFLSGLSPVVATGAVGYAPVEGRVEDGLDLSLIVGTDADAQGGASIDVSGELRRVTWSNDVVDARISEAAPMQMRFPIVSTRSIQSHLRVEHGKLIVLSVLSGFEDKECFVLAASIRKL